MRKLLLPFFGVYLVALTFPGIVPFNRVEPFVFGLPLAFAWVVLWVILGWAALIAVYLTERKQGR